jgi:hypothetical protein
VIGYAGDRRPSDRGRLAPTSYFKDRVEPQATDSPEMAQIAGDELEIASVSKRKATQSSAIGRRGRVRRTRPGALTN